MTPDELHIVQTCWACPEQYDVFHGNSEAQVGYIRLRGGRMRVDCPDVGEEVVFEHEWPDDPYKGEFEDEEERQHFLTKARNAIAEWWNRQLPKGGCSASRSP